MFRSFSEQQLKALTWWCPASGYSDREAIICDGAVRSGKTLCMGLSYFIWAMECFDGQSFALCGRSIKSLRRNVLDAVLPELRAMGYAVRDELSRDRLCVEWEGRKNSFYLFGGGDEASAAHVQGITLAGVLMDEVVLMTRSFVEQACARCSVPGSRLWFNCNPDGPQHWFYREWICRAEERGALYLRFALEDNPGLSPEIVRRYMNMYTGTFHRRFILGQWTAAEGLVYDFFSEDMMASPPRDEEIEQWVISCDYGTANPASFGLWGLRAGVWYRVKEYYFASRREGYQKTDGDYVKDLLVLAGGRRIERVVADPSAASFILALARAGFTVVKARNEVLSGIRTTAEMLKSGRIVICRGCRDSLREFSLYRWKGDGHGDEVIKENDHAMDDIRYFAHTVAAASGKGFAAKAVERGG
ncbi:MAG: PBSX family phage terminase large subunit [Oscillospiraceae bacterium]|nr:PBSX family phage terminase large subunit [Oscillospiraceae bacterium]